MKGLTKEERLIVKLARSVTEHNIRVNKKDFDNIDWSNLMQILKSQKLFLLIFERIRCYLPSHVYLQFYEEYEQMIDKVDKSIFVSKKVSDEFDFPHCLVKGFVLSQILYGNPYSRDFNDVDFLMNKDKIVESAYILEKLLFREYNLYELETYASVPDFAKELYYHIDFEKQFVRDGMEVEIKSFASNEYDKNDVKIALSSVDNITVNDLEFRTIDLRETFIYLLTNTYTNFMSDWGIYHDYRIRDIVDFKQFIEKYSHIFTCDLFEYIKQRNKNEMLYEVLRIVYEFYGNCGSLSNILDGYCSTNNCDDIFGQMSLLNRIFDRKKRSLLYNEYISNHSINNHKYQIVEPTKIDDLKYYDYRNGMVSARYPIWPNNPTILNITGGIILSGIDYDNDYIYINMKIPKSYPELCTKIQIRSKLQNKFIIFHLNRDGAREYEANTKDFKVICNDFEYYKVITVKVLREKDCEFIEDNDCYYYLCYDMCAGSNYISYGPKIAMWGSNNCYLKICLR